MENTFLVKIQKNVNQRKHIHKNSSARSLSQLKSRILTIKIGVIIFEKKKPIFLCQAEQVLVFLGI